VLPRFQEAGKRRLTGETARPATNSEVQPYFVTVTIGLSSIVDMVVVSVMVTTDLVLLTKAGTDADTLQV
jgi:hypothetical protein